MELKFIIPMVICAMVMIWANIQYKSKGKMWGRVVAILFAVLCFGLAISSAVFTLFLKDRIAVDNMISKNDRYLQISHNIFGKHVAEKQKGKKALIIHIKPESGERAQNSHKYSIEEFKAQISGNIEIIDTYEWAPFAEMGNVPENMRLSKGAEFTTKIFNDIISNFSDYDLIISFIGLPRDFKEMKYWSDDYDGKIPQFVLINSSLRDYKPGIAAGHFVSTLATKPGSDYDAEIPKDSQEAFDSRYIIITPKNVETLHKEYPNLFAKE